MKWLKKFNESKRPSEYIYGRDLFKYILMDEFSEIERDILLKEEKEKCASILKDWIEKWTDCDYRIVQSTTKKIEMYLNDRHILIFEKLKDDYYLIRGLVRIFGNTMPICAIFDSMDGIKQWSKTDPSYHIEEDGSLK